MNVIMNVIIIIGSVARHAAAAFQVVESNRIESVAVESVTAAPTPRQRATCAHASLTDAPERRREPPPPVVVVVVVVVASESTRRARERKKHTERERVNE